MNPFGGSHTNIAFRAIAARAKRWDSNACHDGRLAIEKMSPQWQDDIQNGVLWQIVSSEIWIHFPEWARLQQAAGNATGQVQKGEDEMQIARKISRPMQDYMHSKGVSSCTYNDIVKKLFDPRFWEVKKTSAGCKKGCRPKKTAS